MKPWHLGEIDLFGQIALNVVPVSNRVYVPGPHDIHSFELSLPFSIFIHHHGNPYLARRTQAPAQQSELIYVIDHSTNRGTCSLGREILRIDSVKRNEEIV